MQLNPEQKQQLREKLRTRISIWNIGGWLMRECGLTAREAIRARTDEEQEIENEILTKAKKDEDAPWTEESLLAELNPPK